MRNSPQASTNSAQADLSALGRQRRPLDCRAQVSTDVVRREGRSEKWNVIQAMESSMREPSDV